MPIFRSCLADERSRHAPHFDCRPGRSDGCQMLEQLCDRRVSNERKAAAEELAMTNIKTKGFDSPAQLREHMAEIDEDRATKETLALADRNTKEDIALMMAQVTDLRDRIYRNWGPTASVDSPADEPPRHPWLKIAVAAAMTFA